MERFGRKVCDCVEAEEALTEESERVSKGKGERRVAVGGVNRAFIPRGRWRLRAAWTCLKNSGEEGEEDSRRFSSMECCISNPAWDFRRVRGDVVPFQCRRTVTLCFPVQMEDNSVSSYLCSLTSTWPCNGMVLF